MFMASSVYSRVDDGSKSSMGEHEYNRHRGWIIQKPRPGDAADRARRRWKMKYRDSVNKGKHKTFTSSVPVKTGGKAGQARAVEECKAHIDRLMDTDSVEPVPFSSLYGKMLTHKERKGLRPSTMNGYRENERFYRLLEAFERLTDCGVIVNTSFNVRDEPIVATPSDAYACFMRTEMDHLALGPFLLEKTEQLGRQASSGWGEESGPPRTRSGE